MTNQSNRRELELNVSLFGPFICRGVQVPHLLPNHRHLVLNVNRRLFEVELSYFIATPPSRGWQRSEDLLVLHSFLSSDILKA